MKLNLAKLVPLSALLCFMLASCKKNNAVSPSSQSNANVTRTTAMIGAMGDEADLEINDLLNDDADVTPESCPTITITPSNDVYPHTKVRDYGSGCTDSNGVTRSGKRFITVYAKKTTAPAGKVISVTTFSDYYVNGVSINGSVKVTVVHSALDGPLTLKVVSTKTVTDEDGNSTSFVNVDMRTQISGSDTEDDDDDSYTIIENAYGTEVAGDSTMTVWKYSSDPANPIMKDANCAFRSQGALKIELKQNGEEYYEYLDYGNGDCDKHATLSVNGGTPEPITMPFYFFASEL